MDSDAARRLALRLSTLGHADREWILARIDGDARRALEALVQELESLGLRPDADMVDTLLRSSVDPAPTSATPDDGDDLSRLLAASASRIDALLANEPAPIRHVISALRPDIRGSLAAEHSSSRLPNARPPTERTRQAVSAAVARCLQVGSSWDVVSKESVRTTRNPERSSPNPGWAGQLRRILPWTR
jgi:hypothetical protein